MVKLGFHVSILGTIDKAVDRARQLGCDTFQIFTRNPRSWSYKQLSDAEVEAFKEKKLCMIFEPVFAHMPYILNLASPDDAIYRKSVHSLSVELTRCAALDIPFLVTHIGSHLGSGAGKGISRIINAVDTAFQRSEVPVTLLLENGSGSGDSIGSKFEELQLILDCVDDDGRVATCFDTCHAYVAGYELGTREGWMETYAAIEETLGFKRLKLVHLNDSVGDLGSGFDKHEHIGLGEIGEEGFKLILQSRLASLPMIMETPVDDRRSDADNMRKARELAAS